MEALVAFMEGAISEKHTFFGTEVKFPIIVWTKMRPTCATENTKKCIVRCFTKETLQWRLHIDNTTRKSIYEKTCGRESITPEVKGDRSMCK
jgi:hypothetical protein